MARIRAAVLLAVLAATACSGGDEKPSGPAPSLGVDCVDRDGDGYGEGCSRGDDCDDRNAEETTQCLRCAEPNTGCPCELGSQPITCYLDKTEADDGTIMCNEGTRYCRDSQWSACENVHTYPLPPERAEATALIPTDGGPVQCNDCSVNCFRISDNLDPVDGGLNDNNSNQTSFVPGGGLTLAQIPQDAGVVEPPPPPTECMPGTAPDIDCDGIPDIYDPFPNDPPFATANPGIFLDIGPGETGTGVIDLDFFINSADVYFLVDQSASMADERDRLKADLVSGDFINDANYNCADVNLNHIADDNGLKSQGIVGAINCIIRDANFGAGFHREIPFTDYADNKQIAFDSYQDITSDRAKVVDAIGQLHTIGNIDWPEASMIALNSLVTGNGQYFGTTKRGIPPRIDCPAGTWGYPCFRDSAIPIVILFTDAMMHNGPDNNNYAYASSRLGLTRGSQMQYFPLASTNDAFGSSYNAGDLTNVVKTFTGDTSLMTSSIDRTTLSCLSQDGGPDAFVRFDLAQSRTVRISSEGSRFDTVLGLYAGQPQAPVVLPASSNTNETAASATDLGAITGSVQISGNTSSMQANYDWSTVRCNADPASKDAVYRFEVTSPTNVEISTVGSSFDTVVSLHNGVPPTAPTYTSSPTTIETLETAESIGAAYNAVLARQGSTTGRTANYLGAEVGCGADNTSPDVVHKFSLAQPTRVRISHEGSSFDTVMALVGDTCGGAASTPPPETETGGSNAVSNASHTFVSGSVVIPMDTAYQNAAMLRAYGLVYTLLLNDIPVSWVIKKSKTSGEADFSVASQNFATSVSNGTATYRGGPFVIDSTDVARATPFINAFLLANPLVVVHRTTANFDGYVRRQLTGAPRFALMRDGSEATARNYLAAAGITDSAGTAWPDATSPDVKTLAQLAGASTSAYDGALFDGTGTPAYCGLISAGWSVAGASTSQGAEIVRETRQFLESATSLFAQNGSPAAFESGTGGRFLTLAGYNAAATPASLFELNIDSPYAQIHGPFTATGAIALPSLDQYRDNDATIYGRSDGSSGEADVWVTARLDGECSILDEACASGQALGRISYLAGNAYSTTQPVTLNEQANGVRLFLNSLFAADCAIKEQRPLPTVLLTGPSATAAASNTYSIAYNNDGEGYAHGAALEYAIPAGATFVSSTGGGVLSGGVVRWSLGSLAPDEAGSVSVTVSYGAYGTFSNQASLRFTHGNTPRTSLSWVITTAYTMAGAIGCTALGVNQVTVPSTNENQSSPYEISELKGRVFRLTGSTSGMQPDYSTSETGSCGAASGSPDATYKFHLDQAADVTISTEGTTGWDTVLSLYNGNISPTTSVAATNAGELTSNAQALGSINGKRIALTGATTGSMAANYDLGDIGCTAEPTTADAVYSFSVSTVPTTVRMTTAGSSFDTVMSLHSNNIVSAAPITTTISNDNDWLYDDAYAVPLSVDGRDQVFLGNTNDLTADLILPQSNCGSSAVPSGKDAVFAFTVGASGTYEIDTTGSSFDTVVAVYDSNPQFTGMNATYMVPEGEDETESGFNLGSIYRSNVAVRGQTDNNSSLSTRTSCGAFGVGSFFGIPLHNPEAALRFTVPSGVGSRQITIETAGSAFDTVLHLYRIDGGDLDYETCNDDQSGSISTSRIVRTLNAGDYVAMITSTGYWERGDYEIRVRDTTSGSPVTDVLACNDTATGGSSRARIPSVSLTAGQTYYAVVKGFNGSADGAYQLQIRDNSLPTAGNSNRVACNDDFAASPQSEITWPITTAGTYYVVVKGGAVGAQGAYSLLIEDTTSPPVGAVLECDDNDGPGGSSMIRRTSLPAGDYWVVLKGKTAAASGAYTLRVLDESAAVGTILECNDDGGLDNAALIERDLAPGTYYVITKGDNAGEAGNYKLSVRDVTNQRLNHLTCDDDGAAAQTSRINADLAPGTYYAVVKGDAASNAGAYTLTVQDTANSPLGAIACNDDGGTYKTSVISRTLNAGTYYVGLKGYNANEKGDYQLTIGGGTTSSGTYVPPTWAQTRDALVGRGVKVIPILSCRDDPDHGNAQGDCNRVRSQAVSLANATNTLGSNLQPLYFDINRNGAGLSKTVVDGVASLAEYLEMDVRVIVKFDPDANPGFLVNIVAIDEVGDGCTGIVGTEHQDCAPGATPRFNIEITNPLPGVPPHPTDPNGGYTFRAQLIGDDQFIVEEVPIYIIPESLEPMGPQEPPVYEEGTYWQDTTSPGCTSDNQTPDWADLSWVADVYRNTTIEFIACTSATQEALDDCTPVEVAEITGAGDCSADSDCPVGYCDTDIGVCQITLGGPCMNDPQCADNAYCDEDIGRCTYESQPVYVGEQLSNANFQRYIRMRINMRVTEPFEDPPVLHRWEMTYFCTNNL